MTIAGDIRRPPPSRCLRLARRVAVSARPPPRRQSRRAAGHSPPAPGRARPRKNRRDDGHQISSVTAFALKSPLDSISRVGAIAGEIDDASPRATPRRAHALASRAAGRATKADRHARPPGARVCDDRAGRTLPRACATRATPERPTTAVLADIVVVLGPSIARSLGGEGCGRLPAAQRLCRIACGSSPTDELAALSAPALRTRPAAPRGPAGCAHAGAPMRACAEGRARRRGALGNGAAGAMSSDLASRPPSARCRRRGLRRRRPAPPRRALSRGLRRGSGARLGDNPGAPAHGDARVRGDGALAPRR